MQGSARDAFHKDIAGQRKLLEKLRREMNSLRPNLA